jgi:beta-glucanase (GH16 family)
VPVLDFPGMHSLCIAALVIKVALSTSSFCDSGPSWTLSFEDDFSGTALNTSAWNVVLGDDSGSCRDAVCIASAVAVTDGSLTLTSQNSSYNYNGVVYNYTTGAVNTRGKVHWSRSSTFRLCVTATLPGGGPGGGGAAYVGTGIWPAVWMMPDDNSCWPDHGEIDILEMIVSSSRVAGVEMSKRSWL